MSSAVRSQHLHHLNRIESLSPLAVRIIRTFRSYSFLEQSATLSKSIVRHSPQTRSKEGRREMASSHCFENAPALNPAGGGGEVIDDFGGQKAYIAGSPQPKAAVILISDAFGFEAPNLRKIADKVASYGYFVVVPDFLHGDPYDPNNPSNPGMWLQSHDPKKAFEEAKPIIAALKAKGVLTIGAAGYCWGAKVVVELAKVHEIQAAVLLHPSLLAVDDIKEVKCPISILGAETDKSTPPELVKQFEQVLSANSEIGHFVKIFPGVEHGWAVRYSNNDEAAVSRAEEALQDMMDWFNKYLK